MQPDAPAPFAARVRAKDLLVGLLVKMPAQPLVELAAYVGFDFVIIDTEHGSADHDQLEHHVRAADAAGVASMIRVASFDPSTVGRVLDSGADGVIFPHVSSPELARLAVRAAHYPPLGDRGLATSTRAGRHGTVMVADHLLRSAESTVVVAQIEDAAAVAHARAIAQTPRVDCVWIGPNDLSLSMERPRSHPDVAQAELEIVRGVQEADAAALAVLSSGADDAAMWSAQGATIVIYAAPTVFAPMLTRLVRDVKANHQLTGAKSMPALDGLPPAE